MITRVEAAAIEAIVVILIILAGVLPLMIWLERKVCAYMQDRIGPNRAAVFGTIRLGGMVHTLTDMIKLITKEDIRPTKANRLFYLLAPFLVVAPVITAAAVIPWADDLNVPPGTSWMQSGYLPLQVARLDVGLLFVFAISGISVFGIMLAGWASNSKYALLGGLRAASQLVSYEIALTLSAVAMMTMYGTVRLESIVHWQEGPPWHWGVFSGYGTGFLAFIVFLVAVFAESNRLPFDLPEGESELVAGYHTEYSGMKFAMFMMAEYAHMFVSSAIIVTLFFGGWQIPWLSTVDAGDASIQVASFMMIAAGVTALALSFFCWKRLAQGPKRWRDRRDFEPALWGTLAGGLGIVLLVLALGFHLPHALPGVAGPAVVALAQFLCFFGKIFVFLFLFLWIRWTLPRFRFDQVMRLGWKALMPIALANVILVGAILVARGPAG